jgi:hypothetical protein
MTPLIEAYMETIKGALTISWLSRWLRKYQNEAAQEHIRECDNLSPTQREFLVMLLVSEGLLH